MKLLLIRHGETEENKKGILQGWLPGHLSAAGKKQAKRVAKRLQHVKIDIIYTSDLTRCLATAHEIKKHHPRARLVKEKRLRERHMGEFQGKPKDQAAWDALPGERHTNRPKGGEAFTDVWKRVNAFYTRLKKEKHATVAIVAHNGSLCVLQGMILKKTVKQSLKYKNHGNTAVSEFEIGKKKRTICMNCTKHLR